MVQFECPRYRNPCVSSIFGEFPFPICILLSSLWGNKRLDLPVWMVEEWKIFRTKSDLQAANGPLWMPQVQETLCLIHFWWIPFPHILSSSLWGNKRLDLPVWMVGNWNIFFDKISWTNWNSPGWINQAQKPSCLSFLGGFSNILNFQKMGYVPVTVVRCPVN